MNRNRNSMWRSVGILLAVGSAIAAGQSASAPDITDHAQRQVIDYLARLADLHCTESVLQEKLAGNGHVEAAERARYDYLIMIGGDGDGIQLNESRLETSTAKHKPLPMLVTNGFSTLLMIFHPYYRASFQFEPGAEETVDGKPALAVRFTQVDGRRAPAALALRGREYPLELQGTAWLDKQSGEVVAMDANLKRDMSDVGLRSLTVHVDYKPSDLGVASGVAMLPRQAVVDVTTPRQHWRNTHVFDNYRSFSTAAEQDPNVKIHAERQATEGAAPEEPKPNPKEKP